MLSGAAQEAERRTGGVNERNEAGGSLQTSSEKATHVHVMPQECIRRPVGVS